jgi:hypothetical protein
MYMYLEMSETSFEPLQICFLKSCQLNFQLRKDPDEIRYLYSSTSEKLVHFYFTQTEDHMGAGGQGGQLPTQFLSE